MNTYGDTAELVKEINGFGSAVNESLNALKTYSETFPVLYGLSFSSNGRMNPSKIAWAKP